MFDFIDFFCLNMSVVGGHLFVLSWVRVRRAARGSVLSE